MGTIALLATADRSAIAQTPLTHHSRLAIAGIGSIQVEIAIADTWQ